MGNESCESERSALDRTDWPEMSAGDVVEVWDLIRPRSTVGAFMGLSHHGHLLLEIGGAECLMDYRTLSRIDVVRHAG